MIIREMNVQDIENVRAIAREAWRDTYSHFIPIDIQDKVLEEAYSDEQMAIRFNTSTNFVAEEDGVLMGYAFFSYKSDGRLYLESIYIDPDHQGKGVGKLLIRTGISKFPKAEILTLTVYRGNSNVSFYEKLGFEVINENEGNFFGHSVTFIQMEKKINK